MIENLKSQMRKGMLEYCILLCLDKKEAYTNEILQQLKDTNLLVAEGTLYPLLSRLKNSGLLDYRWQESTEGPPRKYYKTTDIGHQLLEDLETEWGVINNAVNQLK